MSYLKKTDGKNVILKSKACLLLKVKIVKIVWSETVLSFTQCKQLVLSFKLRL